GTIRAHPGTFFGATTKRWVFFVASYSTSVLSFYICRVIRYVALSFVLRCVHTVYLRLIGSLGSLGTVTTAPLSWLFVFICRLPPARCAQLGTLSPSALTSPLLLLAALEFGQSCSSVQPPTLFNVVGPAPTRRSTRIWSILQFGSAPNVVGVDTYGEAVACVPLS
ncbi:unnamed protein product, partial [Ectocarpus sp. 4 AP-2014]